MTGTDRPIPAQVTVPTDDGPMPGLAWLPGPDAGTGASADPAPGVVVFQEIFGLSDYLLSRCAALCAAGFAVLAPDFYWRLGGARVDERADDFMATAMGLLARVDWGLAVDDGRAAVRWWRQQCDVGSGSGSAAGSGVDGARRSRIGALGFCFGGGLAFEVAAGPEDAIVDGPSGEGAAPRRADDAGRPDALVAYYGSALPRLTPLAHRVRCPQLHHFGLADAFIPEEQVRIIEAAVTAGRGDVTMQTYPGAGHAFDNPHPMFHDPGASALAWPRTLTWLAEQLAN